MKHITKILIYAWLVLATCLQPWHTASIEVTISQKEDPTLVELSRQEIFHFYADIFDTYIPESYTYIQLNYKDVTQGHASYEDLQKLVYINAIQNSSKSAYLDKHMNAYVFYLLSSDILGIKLTNITPQSIHFLKSRNTTQQDLDFISSLISGKQTPRVDVPRLPSSTQDIEYKKEIFFDVYKTLLNKHYGKAEFDENEIINKAIEWLTQWTKDQHTVYFPPVESQWFTESLNGEYEWIGAYVDMKKPWVLEIITPIAGSPSEKSGLKWWDIVTHVDGQEVTEKNSLRQVISWIKWPAWSEVILTISRNNTTKDITVTREKIIIKDIEYSKTNSSTMYIQMKSFGEKSSQQFRNVLEEIQQDTRIRKIILDLRNNGGGYLWQVSNILSHFVPNNEPVAVVKYIGREEPLVSKWYEGIDLNKYRVVVLQNSGTASASEILIGTLKDYYPDITTIWEKSYGKWSVQTTKTYTDGSLLKYTIAKWYTGKTQTGIDGVGLMPDMELPLDDTRYLKNGYDNQLETAKRIR